MGTVTWWDRFISPLPWLPWLGIAAVAFMLVALAAVYWAIRYVDKSKILTPGYDVHEQIVKEPLAVAVYWGLIMAAMVLGLLIVLGLVTERAVFGATPAYDGLFRRAALEQFGAAPDWQHFKAQGYAESRLRPHVCSSVGACGLMQIMPATARDFRCDPFRPAEAVRCGVRIDRAYWRFWTAGRTLANHFAWMLAAYNAGPGNVIKFQRAAAQDGCDVNDWLCVEPHAWKEPRTYIRRIARVCVRLRGVGCWPLGASP